MSRQETVIFLPIHTQNEHFSIHNAQPITKKRQLILHKSETAPRSRPTPNRSPPNPSIPFPPHGGKGTPPPGPSSPQQWRPHRPGALKRTLLDRLITHAPSLPTAAAGSEGGACGRRVLSGRAFHDLTESSAGERARWAGEAQALSLKDELASHLRGLGGGVPYLPPGRKGSKGFGGRYRQPPAPPYQNARTTSRKTRIRIPSSRTSARRAFISPLTIETTSVSTRSRVSIVSASSVVP